MFGYPAESENNQLEFTVRVGCATQCEYCPQDGFVKAYRKISDVFEMSIDKYTEYVSKMSQDMNISISGFTEPLVHPHIPEFIEIGHRFGKRVSVHTSLVNVGIENLISMIYCRPEYIQVHIIARDWESNQKWDDEMISKLELCHSICKNIGIRLDINCFGELPKELIGAKIGEIHGSKENIFDRVGDNKKIVSPDFTGYSVNCCKSSNFKYGVCLPDGTVALCCMDFHLKNTLGNLNDFMSIDEMFKKSETIRRLSQNRNTGEKCICSHCALAYIPDAKELDDYLKNSGMAGT